MIFAMSFYYKHNIYVLYNYFILINTKNNIFTIGLFFCILYFIYSLMIFHLFEN